MRGLLLPLIILPNVRAATKHKSGAKDVLDLCMSSCVMEIKLVVMCSCDCSILGYDNP